MWSVPAALLYGLYNRYSSYLGRLYVGARFKKKRDFSRAQSWAKYAAPVVLAASLARLTV